MTEETQKELTLIAQRDKVRRRDVALLTSTTRRLYRAGMNPRDIISKIETALIDAGIQKQAEET